MPSSVETPKRRKELKNVSIREANNGYTISKYTDWGESVEVATSWEKAVEAAKKMMGVKGAKT